MVLASPAQSWITGYNSNVAAYEYGKAQFNVYQGGAPRYQKKLATIAAEGFTARHFA